MWIHTIFPLKKIFPTLYLFQHLAISQRTRHFILFYIFFTDGQSKCKHPPKSRKKESSYRHFHVYNFCFQRHQQYFILLSTHTQHRRLKKLFNFTTFSIVSANLFIYLLYFFSARRKCSIVVVSLFFIFRNDQKIHEKKFLKAW